MDKNCLQVLAEVSGYHVDEVAVKKSAIVRFTSEEALEAMKIFGRKCFEAGTNITVDDDGEDWHPTYNDFDEYFSSLEKEEGK